jgi:hypothetical protein
MTADKCTHSVMGPRAVSGFSVRPEALRVAAGDHERTAQVLSDAARAVGWLVVPTGRRDSEHECALAVEHLADRIQSLVFEVEHEAAAVRAGADCYTAVDRQALLF